MILKYSDFLFENNIYIDYLYHIVDFEKLFRILKTNTIESYKFSNISMTRNPFLIGYVGDSPVSLFKLEIDNKKLIEDYDTKEFVYVSQTNVTFEDEEEEQIQTHKIKNVDKYVTKLIIMKNRMNRLMDSGWFNTDGGWFNSKSGNNIPDLLQKILKLNKYPVYVQDGRKIKKDDEYINSILNHPIEKIYHGYAIYKKEEKRVEKYKKYKATINIFIPLDKRNNIIDDLVVGWNYNNLYLLKDVPDIKKLKNVTIFNFKYELKNIIDEDDKYLYVKEAYLGDLIFVK